MFWETGVNANAFSVYYNCCLKKRCYTFKNVFPFYPHQIKCRSSGKITDTSFQHCTWGEGRDKTGALLACMKNCTKTFVHDCSFNRHFFQTSARLNVVIKLIFQCQKKDLSRIVYFCLRYPKRSNKT